MSFLIAATDNTHKRTTLTFKNNSRALILMGKQLFIWYHICASFIGMYAFKHDFTKEISCHPVYSIELALLSAERTSIWVLLEPLVFAVTTERLFTCLTFNWVFQYVIADATNQLCQECFNVTCVEYFLLFIDVLLINLTLVYYLFHSFRN